MNALFVLSPSLPPLAANVPNWLDQVSFQASGMLVVVVALTGSWLVVALLSRALRVFVPTVEVPESQAAMGTSGAFSATSGAIAPADTLDPHLVAAISAAVHTVLQGRARVVSIVPHTGHSQVWSQEGRRDIYQSHRVR